MISEEGRNKKKEMRKEEKNFVQKEEDGRRELMEEGKNR